MTVSSNEVVTRMRQALSISEPGLDTTIGTPVRKILDAVGEVVFEATTDKNLLTYQYDIGAKTGADLDEFVRLFGFTRLAAKRATGTILFERTSATTEDISIPLGTQVTTQGASPVVVATTAPAIMVIGQSTIEIPVQATVGGTIGNVPANSLKYRVSALNGISSFTNPAALTGGGDAESDDSLRTRFLATVFRNLAGTEDQFLAVALNDPSVTKASVIGATKVWREIIEVVGGSVTSTVQGARFVYPDSQVFGKNLEAGEILIPNVHYSFNLAVNPPQVTILDPIAAPDGIYELQFEYVPTASRNDPQSGVTNRIDIYVTGTRVTPASESRTFSSSSIFTNTTDDAMNVNNFEREDGTHPVVGNYLFAFGMNPAVGPAPETLVVDGITYTRDTDYWLVVDTSIHGGGPTSLSGLEWRSTANGATDVPADGALVNVDYLFNAVPGDVELAARAWRLITTDVRVHQARPVYLNLHLAVVYSRGYTEASVRPGLEAALSAYLSSVGFSGLVEVSDLLEVAHSVPGVDSVRFLTDSDNATNFAIQVVSSTGTVLSTSATSVVGQIRRALDVQIGDHEYPVFNSLTLVTKAFNTFGAV